jgi:hypothetical protein
MKSRSSTGVGMKIDLEYNVETMRITDEGGEDGVGSGSSYNNPQPSPNNIMQRLKPSSSVSPSDETDNSPPMIRAVPKVTEDVQGSKLKAMLNNLKR